MTRSKYSQYDVDRFFRILGKYEQALKTGTKMEIIAYSLAIHAAKGNVPPRLRSLVNKTFKETSRETPLEG